MNSAKMFEKRLKKFIMDNGADLVGIANVERFEGAPEGCKPRDLLPNAKSVIALARHIPDGVVDSLPSASYMAQGYLNLSETLNWLSFEVARFLEKHGNKSLPIPASYNQKERRIWGEWPNIGLHFLSTFSHRHSAEKAGLGQIGRNNILITPEYGPRCRLSSIITTVALEPDPILEGEVCPCKRECLSIVRCPAKALGEYTTDHWKCMYLNEYAYIENDPDFEKKNRALEKMFKEKANQHPLEISSHLLGHTDYGAECCGVCLKSCVIGIESAKKRLK